MRGVRISREDSLLLLVVVLLVLLAEGQTCSEEESAENENHHCCSCGGEGRFLLPIHSGCGDSEFAELCSAAPHPARLHSLLRGRIDAVVLCSNSGSWVKQKYGDVKFPQEAPEMGVRYKISW